MSVSFSQVGEKEWKPDATANERRALRQSYRQLLEKADVQRDEITSAASTKLDEITRRADRLYEDVQALPEAALDAQFSALAASLGQKKAAHLNADLQRYDAQEFSAKLAAIVRDPARWRTLGKKVSAHFRRAPGWETMLGPVQLEKKVRQVAQRHARDRVEQAIAPELIENTKNAQQDEAETTARVQKVLAALERAYVKREQRGLDVEFFELICNPDSFTQTVENLFHLSFLINKGRAATYLSEDGRLLVKPAVPGEAAIGQRGSQQAIMTLTQEMWANVVESYQLTKPIIPTRDRIRTDDYLPAARSQEAHELVSSVAQPRKRSRQQ